ncbi:MAG TPA: cobalamin-binding protein [bacterium]|nr:cobalamin-binding protein [bacterium]
MASLLILALVFTAGCGNKAEAPLDPGADGVSFTMVDDMDREVTMTRPGRIISLAPSSTEILFALGLDDKVVGVDDYSDFPAAVETVAKVGAYDNPSIEKIIALRPDLVLADSIHKTAVQKLEELGIPVAVVFPRDLEGVLYSIRWIGIAAGARDEATVLEGELSRRLDLIDNKLDDIPTDKRPWVYYELYSDPLMTCGPNTLSSELIVRAGGRNIAYDAATNYPEFSPEAIVSRNPDVIIFPDLHGTEAIQAEAIKARPGWSSIKAVQNSRLYAVDDDLIARPGPRIVEGLEQMVRCFHPDL